MPPRSPVITDRKPILTPDMLPPILLDEDGRPAYFMGRHVNQNDRTEFTGRDAHPGIPLDPYYEPGTDPRAWFPFVGYNLSYVPRGEFNALTPFQILRSMADNCDAVRVVMEDVKGQVLGLKWDVKEKDDASQKDTSGVAAMKAALQFPDGVHEFGGWLSRILDEVYTTDALSLYRWRKKGGEPLGLLQLDGATIKPIVDYHGLPADPPEPAFQQIIMGRVETEFTTSWRSPSPFDPFGRTKYELTYQPRWGRVHTPYGQSPVERIIMTVNLILRRQMHYLAYYTAGTVPEGFYRMPQNFTSQQVQQFQKYFDELLSGDPDARSRIRFLPGGEGTGLEEARKHDSWTYDFDEFLWRIVCWAFGTSPLPVAREMNRATSEQADVSETDRELKPMMQYLKAILDREIREFYGYDGLEFVWTEEKAEDERLKFERNVAYMDKGVLVASEVRADLGKPPMTPEQQAEAASAGPPEAPTGPSSPGPGGAFGAGADAAGKVLSEVPALKTAGAGVDAELGRWRRMAVKAVQAGRRVREFRTDVVPADLKTALNEWLPEARTREDVAWGFQSLTKARRPAVIARRRIRLQRRMKAAAAAHFRKNAAALAKVVGDWYAEHAPQGKGEKARRAGPDDEALFRAMDWRGLADVLKPILLDAFLDGEVVAFDRAPVRKAGEVNVVFGLTDAAAMEYAEARAAELVGMTRQPDGTLVRNPNPRWSLAQTTRDQIRAMVKKAIDEQWTEAQLSEAIADEGVWDWRADMIARTETAFAMNSGTAASYREAGVEEVKVLDGRGCLQEGHDDDQRGVNGEIWTLEESEEYPLGHPNCTRDFAPVVPTER